MPKTNIVYMTTGEAARMLGVGLNTIKRWITSGDLRGVRMPSGHWRIPQDGLHSFMLEHDMQIQASEESTPARVLIIDDDPSECALLKALLEQADFFSEVQCAHDGYTGLLRIGAWRPDVLVLDILMPGINGLEVLRRLKDGPDFDGMAIVVITAIFDQPRVIQAVRAAGVAAMLPKPVEARLFLAAVGACLTRPVAYHDGQPQ